MPKLIRSLVAVLCLSAMPLVVSAIAQVPAPTNAPANTDRDIDINAIVQRSAHVTEADREASSEYEFSETDWEPNGSHRTYAVHMLYGSPYRQLIAIDGEPLPGDKQQEEERKLHKEIVRRAHESPKQHARRIAEQEKENTRDRRFVEEFVHAFRFELRGEQEMDQRRVYVVEAIPRPGFHPTDRDSAVLTGMRGTLYIDMQTDQWVKAEAEVTHPVSMAGFIATVEPGTRFVLEKTRLEDNIWLPRHFTMTAKAEILSLIHHHEHEDVTYFNYHKAKPPSS
jgi:hypothetical protein